VLVKTNVDIAFLKGLDTKTDPKRVEIGNFLALQNSVFTKGGLLQKRNGYQQLSSLPNNSFSYLTTFNDNLTAIGTSIAALSASTNSWVNKGTYSSVEINTLPLIRNSVNQTQCDSVTSSSGLCLTVYTETVAGSSVYKYAIADSTTGQNIVAPTAIPGSISGSPRCYVVGAYFVIVAPVSTLLIYVSIPIANPSIISASQTLVSEVYVAISSNPGWDAASLNNASNNALIVSYNTTAGAQGVHVAYLSEIQISLNSTTSTVLDFNGPTNVAALLSVCIDQTVTPPTVYISFWNNANSYVYVASAYVYNGTLIQNFAPSSLLSLPSVTNITAAAQNGSCQVLAENSNTYSYNSVVTNAIFTGFISSAGTPLSNYTVVRGVGIASKAFIVNGVVYLLVAYNGGTAQTINPVQQTYFLINASSSTQANPLVIAKLAYENGNGYLTLGLPNVSVFENTASIPYLYKDLIQALETLNNSQQTTTGGVYSQTGVNIGLFSIGSENIDSSEVGNNLNISGGFGWMYDGYLPVEQNFFLWPDNVSCTWSTSGGFIHAQPDGATNTNAYAYQAVYEWSDNQGNIFRSAPSIPFFVTTTGSGTGGSITVNVPTLRLTYKVASTSNQMKIVIYRWSVANQVYYQVTSITSPELNSTSSDSVAFVDKLADASIVGNSIIYTNGGVLEDVNPPGYNITTLFDTRQWVVDAEDQNLLWFSKQIIEGTPVEFSDLLTFYIAPNTGTTGATGPITALAPMDDKLIIFKKDAIYYINGSGPDNTGANNQYSQPIFVTSTVGCSNQASVVLMQNGLMFQSDKGIWLLGRDLSTNYIGAPVEAFNSSNVNSAVNVPETNQIRLTLSTGQTLMYDYYYEQWGTFSGVPSVSSCIYQGLHSFINSSGVTYQESPGLYLDGSNPVLLSFITSWINMAGLQGYQRAYFFYLLGQYFSPHKLNLQIAYDYNPSPIQSTLILPSNFSSSVPSPYGDVSAPFGASPDQEQWRIFLTKQRCQAFQIILTEVYDSSLGVGPGQGLSLSGINIVYAMKKGWRTISAAQSAGGQTGNR
jgi:hypothetical protein